MVVGRHLIAELSCCKQFLTKGELKLCLIEAASQAKTKLLNIAMHEFDTVGEVTAVALLSESHISIHCWPEYEFVACDIFVCGEAEPEKALEVIEAAFLPENVQINLLERGNSNAA